MPSECPKMPGETFDTMLRYGSSKGLGLQSNEVAWMKPKFGSNISKNLKLFAAGSAIGVCITIAGVVLLLNR